jgi:acyl carrier protein
MNQETIENWLLDKLAISLSINAEEIDSEKSIFAYGLDSSVALSLTGDIEVWLNLVLEPTLLWEYPKISELAKYLVNEIAKNRGN